jgi:hypothetical protein
VDPGWRPALHALVPFAGRRRLMREPPNGITLLRLVFIAFCASIVFFGVVAASLHLDTDTSLVPVYALAVYAVVVTLMWGRFDPPLDGTSEVALYVSYRARMLLRIAFAELIAVPAFFLRVVTGPPWIYFFGGSYALLWLIVMGPTRRGFQSDQTALDAKGCNISVVVALSGLGRDD